MHLHQLKPKDFGISISLCKEWNGMYSPGHVNHTVFVLYRKTARVYTYIQLGFDVIEKRSDKITILNNVDLTYLVKLMHLSSLKIGHRVIRFGIKIYDFISGVFLQLDNSILCPVYCKLDSFNYKESKITLVFNKIKKNCHSLVKIK